MSSIEEVEVRVLFFGKARELMECEEMRAHIPRVLPYIELKELIFNKLFGVLDCISTSCVLAVDLRFVYLLSRYKFTSLAVQLTSRLFLMLASLA
ncbi:hypothetical protein Y032_0030g2091 [Ancylostoma ceylanicum]|uniref:Uncharacterized protein n=1 Tax=Ancylostoma ceylanicum TaxID=53326 RepID=A0A016URR0_9BILA|nr:hypothetical protein Y032_0030g2091 [Ancylostoma ceylanicum]